MIVIRVELWSAVDGQKTELARAMIHNVGGTNNVGDYEGESYRGRSEAALDAAMLRQQVTKRGKVTGHRRLDLHVWHLVAKMLASMGYGQ
jgi:hypothetical protein